MRVLTISFCLAFGLSGCATLSPAPSEPQPGTADAASGALASSGAGTTRPRLRPSAGADDVTSSSDTPSAEAGQQSAQTGQIGRSVGSLGNAAEPGLWVKTPLVDRQQSGRVTAADTGRSADVTLIPLDGPESAGSQLSLATMQALGVPLTSLPVVEIVGI